MPILSQPVTGCIPPLLTPPDHLFYDLRMTLQTLLDQFRLDPRFMANVAAWERLPARPAQYAHFPGSLDPRLIDTVQRGGATRLYSHQARALDAALRGENVVLVTGTASGKSLAYHLTALQTLLDAPSATALYLFPTKALAQDQAASLGGLLDLLDPHPPIPVNIYDGDTPQSRRTGIRKMGGVLISNPDMLHMGILPYHARWVRFFSNLKIVVLDELHTYRGVFGSHMANLLRRLRRVCQFYGTNPVFICTSATIANPRELAERLLEAPVTLIDEDGAPRGEKHVILYNPPTIDERLGLRQSYLLATRALTGQLLAEDVQTIVFAGSRLGAEVLLGYVKDEVEGAEGDPTAIRGYRGGYLAEERRGIEAGLRSGEVQGVVATNALELGVDIGALGAAVLAGYPGTIASTWQQIGRAGRRSGLSAGIMVASGAPLDQYIATHPRYLFEAAPEHALINPDNLVILLNHLRCAAYELPFERGESFGGFEEAEVLLEVLEERQEVMLSGELYRWTSPEYPAADISLRTGTSDTVVIQDMADGARVIGQIDRLSVTILIYEGAVYLHEGRGYLIDHLDWEGGIAHARPAEVDYYTRSSAATDVDVREEFDTRLMGTCVLGVGQMQVTQSASNYRMVKRYTHETLGYGRIDLPPQSFETMGTWLAIDEQTARRLFDEGVLMRPNDYGPNWHEQRDRARARDGYRCVECGAPERETRQHDVHHIQPFRSFGYVAGQNTAYLEANQLENLITLCGSCHQRVETAQGAPSALGGLRNVIHNLATLHLMCAPGDIGVVAEPRSRYTGGPTLTVYDTTPGGLDLATRLYDLHETVLADALDLVRDCPCDAGCPACVGPVGEVGAGTKGLTIRLIEALLSPGTPSTPLDDPSLF